MEKINLTRNNVIASNVEKIAELFPNCVTEQKGKNDKIELAIDFEKLKDELSENLIKDKKESYQFTWPEKQKYSHFANMSTTKALRPCREESVDFDNTKNLYIEGDNLDVLKCLRETYLKKVKMIYIDPPYNRGEDKIYKDNYVNSEEQYLALSGKVDNQGNHLFVNVDSNGRFHTDWLNMMYPRLKVARDLLADEGVIFISIDDNEQANLKKICDEIMGVKNFVATIHCQMSTTQGMKVKSAQEGNIVKNAEYILCYSKNGCKNIALVPLYDLRPKYDEHYSLYLRQDGTIGQLSERYDYKFPKDCANKKPLSLDEAYRKSEHFAEFVRSHLADIVRTDKVTGFDLEPQLKNGCWTEITRKGKKYLLTLDNKGTVSQLLRLQDSWGETDGFYEEVGLRKIRGDWWDGFYIDMGNVSKEGNVDFKNGKKPVRLIKQLAKMLTQGDDIILDFFSGSATTAHAVMQLNEEDGGKRQFIMVQIPEIIDPENETSKEAKKSARDAIKFLDSISAPHNICEIGKERIRRAGKKIKDDSPLTTQDLDIGFRVLKLDTSNMEDVYISPEDFDQKNLFANNIKVDRTSEDLLFQVMLSKGVMLSAHMQTIKVNNKTIYEVNEEDKYLIACFDENIDEDTIKEIAQLKPDYFVMRDSSVANDNVIDNYKQIFEHYSPKTNCSKI